MESPGQVPGPARGQAGGGGELAGQNAPWMPEALSWNCPPPCGWGTPSPCVLGRGGDPRQSLGKHISEGTLCTHHPVPAESLPGGWQQRARPSSRPQLPAAWPCFCPAHRGWTPTYSFTDLRRSHPVPLTVYFLQRSQGCCHRAGNRGGSTHRAHPGTGNPCPHPDSITVQGTNLGLSHLLPGCEPRKPLSHHPVPKVSPSCDLPHQIRLSSPPRRGAAWRVQGADRRLCLLLPQSQAVLLDPTSRGPAVGELRLLPNFPWKPPEVTTTGLDLHNLPRTHTLAMTLSDPHCKVDCWFYFIGEETESPTGPVSCSKPPSKSGAGRVFNPGADPSPPTPPNPGIVEPWSPSSMSPRHQHPGASIQGLTLQPTELVMSALP
ncbi:uncharacterized protein LOC123650600 [Lemur catta]|uniref:uncharacterized protein LOC123650600 n=1 Tax=Lemur catta TaxID=9447 RepID=UPI001E26AD62|nr:uncharacterized protein LOC123650600 [Lemur catta]XP_045425444.1 uncharacterized protein LOC123650600 [Lemur catta]